MIKHCSVVTAFTTEATDKNKCFISKLFKPKDRIIYRKVFVAVIKVLFYVFLYSLLAVVDWHER